VSLAGPMLVSTRASPYQPRPLQISTYPTIDVPTRKLGLLSGYLSALRLEPSPAHTAAIYCASKSAVIGLTRCDAIDYSKHLIRVNAVCPGIIDTPMTQPRQPGSTGADAGFGGPAVPLPAGMSNEAGLRQNPMDITRAVGIAPMDRKGTTDEIADVVLFLCSEKASFVQGAAWVVDGGYTIN
jgi:NAD(P)-dependent dehydrogenase (short-subunit alcohol dehydrogenase family)